MNDAPRLRMSEKALFGAGSIGNGIINGAVASLLLLFYNQAVGLDPAMVGLALMISIILDALWDPLIGHWTDNTRTRWGRRHPFMYVAALPTAISFYMLFSPPLGWSHDALFFYLLGTVMVLRFSISVFEISSNALVPELVPDYDERTNMWSYRFFFGLVGGLVGITLAYSVFLPSGGGLSSASGYAKYGFASAVIILLVLLVSALSVHRWIPKLRAPAVAHWSMAEIWHDLSSVLNNRTFVVLMLSGLASGLSTGLTSSLGLYMNGYFWGLTPQSISALATGALLASMVGVMLAPALSRRLGKKEAMILLFWASLFVSVIPVTLRLLGLMPPNGSELLFWILLADSIVAGVLGFMGLVIVVSLMTDVVEDIAAKTGRRTEGQIFAFQGVLQKCISGVGTFSAGLLLAYVHFPVQAVPGQVDESILRHMAIIYVPITTTLVVISLALLSFLKVDKTQHAANLKRLEEVEGASTFANDVSVTTAPQILPEGGSVRLS